MSDEKGHPLPESDEARHNEIPEHLEREKGKGEEGHEVVQPTQPAIAPDGEPYRYDDLGR
jgi:wyosine [tRNA(Phe)-imidazoG37] synthetase (radical SAM superfamily)